MVVIRELVLAIGVPLILLLLALLALEHWSDRLPAWLRRLVDRSSRIWTLGIGLILALNLLRWLLLR